MSLRNAGMSPPTLHRGDGLPALGGPPYSAAWLDPLNCSPANLRNELGPQAGSVQLSLGLFSLELMHWKEVNLELQTTVSLPWWRSCLERMRQASLGGRNESERDSLDGI